MTAWADMAAGFPPDRGPAREAAIIEAVRRGDYVTPNWQAVGVLGASLRMTFTVMTESLRLGDESDSVTPMCTAATAQTIADLLDARLPTSKLLDSAAQAAECFVDFEDILRWQHYDVENMTTAQMVRMSRFVDSLRSGCDPGELRSPAGKQWIPSNQLAYPAQFPKTGKDTACNYGGYTRSDVGAGGKRPWPAVSTSQLRVWQPMAYRHSTRHVDSIQFTPQLIGTAVVLDSPSLGTVTRPIDEVAISLATASLVSVEGPTVLRYPFLPHCQSLEQGGGCPPSPAPGEPGPTPTLQPAPATDPSSALKWALAITALAAAGLFIVYEVTS